MKISSAAASEACTNEIRDASPPSLMRAIAAECMMTKTLPPAVMSSASDELAWKDLAAAAFKYAASFAARGGTAAPSGSATAGFSAALTATASFETTISSVESAATDSSRTVVLAEKAQDALGSPVAVVPKFVNVKSAAEERVEVDVEEGEMKIVAAAVTATTRMIAEAVKTIAETVKTIAEAVNLTNAGNQAILETAALTLHCTLESNSIPNWITIAETKVKMEKYSQPKKQREGGFRILFALYAFCLLSEKERNAKM